MIAKLRFLCVHQGYELYGSDRMFIQSVQAIRESFPNAHITVHIPQHGTLAEYLSGYASEIITDELIILRRNMMSWKTLYCFPKILLETYKRIKTYDTVYINTITVLSYLPVSRFTKKKCLVNIHEIARPFEKIIFNALVWWSHAVLICNSKATRNALLVTRHKSKLLYNGIHIENNIPVNVTHKKLHLLLIGRMNA